MKGNRTSKLTREQRLKCRAWHKLGWSYARMARELGVDYDPVWYHMRWRAKLRIDTRGEHAPRTQPADPSPQQH